MASHPQKQVQLIWILRQKEEPFLLSWQCHNTQGVIHTRVLLNCNPTVPHCAPWGADGVKERGTGTSIRTGTAHLSTHVHPAGKSLSFAAAQVPHQPLPLSRVLLPCCLIFPLLLSNIRAQEEGDCTEGLSQNHPSPSTAKGPWLLSFSFSPDASPRYHQHFGPEVALLTQYFSVGAPSFKLQVIFWLRMF